MHFLHRPHLALLVARAWFGGTMAFAHGVPKFVKLTSGDFGFPDPLGVGAPASLGLAVFGELVCGLLIASGLFTRLATVPAAITMGVAAFITHGADPFQKKELALAYLFAYVVIAVAGPGKYSLDALRGRS